MDNDNQEAIALHRFGVIAEAANCWRPGCLHMERPGSVNTTRHEWMEMAALTMWPSILESRCVWR